MSMAAPVFRLRKERLPQVAGLVMAAAQRLSADLGHQSLVEPKAEQAPLLGPYFTS